MFNLGNNINLFERQRRNDATPRSSRSFTPQPEQPKAVVKTIIKYLPLPKPKTKTIDTQTETIQHSTVGSNTDIKTTSSIGMNTNPIIQHSIACDTIELIKKTTLDVTTITEALEVCDKACGTELKTSDASCSTEIKTSDASCSTEIKTSDASCDTSELQEKEKERKALELFKKRIAEQKEKAIRLKAFISASSNQQEEEDPEDE